MLARCAIACVLSAACAAVPTTLEPEAGNRLDCSLEALCLSAAGVEELPHRDDRERLLQELPERRALIEGLEDRADEEPWQWLSPLDALVEMRRRIETLASPSEREVLFESLPQGLRLWSGVPRREESYLRNGILRVHTFTPDAVDQDHSLVELQRNVSVLRELLAEQGPRTRLAPLGGSTPSRGGGVDTELACHPADLYGRLLALDPSAVDGPGVTLVSAYLPYEGRGGRRVRSYSIYFTPSGVIGYDALDTEERAHHRDHRFPSWLGAWLSRAWSPLRWSYDLLFGTEVTGLRYPLLAPVNLALSTAVHAATTAKEAVLEVAKSPLSALASTISSDASLERFGGSFVQPPASIGSVARFHWGQLVENGLHDGPIHSLDLALQQLPLVGNYMPHYFDDSWTQLSEAPPRPNHGLRAVVDAGQVEERGVEVFLSRGIHGGGKDDQGNDTWKQWVESLDRRDSLEASALADDTPRFRVHDSPYPWGTFMDPVFSLLNLSHGYAYTLAEDVVEEVPRDGGTPPVVSFVAHSGGVQRAAMASRFLWNRDVFTEGVYGVAGPGTAYAPTKPDQYRQVLSRSEFRDSDFTSRVSLAVAAVEDAILQVFEVPYVGTMWILTTLSRGYGTTYQNIDTLRIEGRESTTHRNPGTVDAERRDLGLTFFRRDLLAFLTEKALLRRAYVRADAPVPTP